jgi:DNA-binding beta-propeller fold protein YncE
MRSRTARIDLLILLAAAALAFPCTAHAVTAVSPSTLFGIAEDPNQLNLVNPNTGAPVLVGNLGLEASNSDMAYDSSTGRMWVSDASTEGWAQTGLAWIDMKTGHATFVGDHGSSINVAGLAYVPVANKLYGSDMDSNNLVTVDRATGAITAVGPFGIVGMRDLAYDPVNDQLWGIDGFSLFMINRTTGNAQYIGKLASFTWQNIMDSLAFDPVTRQLYGGDWGGAFGSRNATLYRISTVNGAATVIGSTGLQLLGALEFGPQIFADGVESGGLTRWSGKAP